ncbi:MAG TPA: group 1 truncated hemoglobin [Candidatus Angelobacter sp.]|nr:group 1 truncated hemoglobin [Candidatus Angelobacter sp.]
MSTIYERYGGFASVRKVVSAFYDRCLESPVIAHHFEHIDMTRLVDHQSRFIASVMGGPASYTDEHLHRVHARLSITHAEFAEMASLLAETLEDQGFADPDVAAVIGNIRAREGSVVAEPAPA